MGALNGVEDQQQSSESKSINKAESHGSLLF